MKLTKIKALAVVLFSMTMANCSSPPKPPATPAESGAPPYISSRPRLGEGANFFYRKGEEAYARREYKQALDAYKKFLGSTQPDHPLTDNAVFKIGMCWFEMKSYRDALYFFNSLISRFPDSENRAEAVINSAICLFQLNEMDDAEAAFDKALNSESRQASRAYIFYYKGSIAEARKDYNASARFFIQAGLLSQNTELIRRAQGQTSRLMLNFLNEKNLQDINSRYSGEWPAVLALEALVRMYSNQGQVEKLAEARKELSLYRRESGQSSTGFEPPPEDDYRPKEIKVGVVLPLTGPGMTAGQEMIQGIQVAMNTFLKFMRNKNIQLMVKDSGHSESGAEDAIRELSENKDVLAIIGPAYSQEFRNASQAAEQNRIPIISPSATEEGAASLSGYLFRTALTNSVEARRIAKLAVGSMGLKRFAVLYPANRQGRELSQYFSMEVKNLGGTVVTAEAYTPDQTDFGYQIKLFGGMTDEQARRKILETASRMRGGGVANINAYLEQVYANEISAPYIVSYSHLPLNERNFLPGLKLKYDAIFIAGMYDKVGLILPELEFYNVKNVRKFSGSGANHPTLVSLAEKYAEGLIFMDGFFQDSSSPLTRTFVKDYRLYFLRDPSILSAQAHDAAVSVLSSIAQGAGTRYELTQSLRSLRYFEGVTGEMTVTPEGDMDKSVYFLTIKDGRIEEFEYVPPPPEAPGFGQDQPEGEGEEGAGQGGQMDQTGPEGANAPVMENSAPASAVEAQ